MPEDKNELQPGRCNSVFDTGQGLGADHVARDANAKDVSQPKIQDQFSGNTRVNAVTVFLIVTFLIEVTRNDRRHALSIVPIVAAMPTNCVATMFPVRLVDWFIMDYGERMPAKLTRPRRPRRPRLLLRSLAAIGLCAVGGALTPNAMTPCTVAQETRLAYYTADPDQETANVRTVANESDTFAGDVRDWVRISALPDGFGADAAIPSSSDLPAPVRRAEDIFELGPPLEATIADEIVRIPPTAPIASPVRLEDRAAGLLPTPHAAKRSSRAALGAVAASFSATPAMIGDFFGGSFVNGFLEESQTTGGFPVTLAGGANRFKVAENVSPIPRDRVFFNYNHFHNAIRNLNGPNQSLDRFTFGVEKTFLDRLASVELRLPLAAGLDSHQDIDNPDARGTELGNLGLAVKFNLLSGEDWIIAAGSSLTVPTGDDYELLYGNARVLSVSNDAVHFAPFLGWLTLVGKKSFLQGFVQFDFDLNGNDVHTDYGGYEGVFQDQNLLFVDIAAGHWLHRSHDPRAYLAGVAAIAELHYTSTLNDSDWVGGLTNPFNRMDVLNATGALHIQSGLTSLRIGGAAPLRSDEERLFDAEVILQLNRLF